MNTKRILSALLALALVFSLAIAALADSDPGGSTFDHGLEMDGVPVGEPFFMDLNVTLQRFLETTIDGPVTWTFDSGALPDGLSFSAEGVITGAIKASGSYSFIVKAEWGADSTTRIYIGIGTTAPTWISKLPNWLSRIGDLPDFLQTIIYYFFFGWVLNFL